MKLMVTYITRHLIILYKLSEVNQISAVAQHSSFYLDITLYEGMFKNGESVAEVFGKLNLQLLSAIRCQGRGL